MFVRNLLYFAADSCAISSVSSALASMVATGRSVEVAFSHILAFNPDWTYLGIDVGVGLSPAFGLRERVFRSGCTVAEFREFCYNSERGGTLRGAEGMEIKKVLKIVALSIGGALLSCLVLIGAAIGLCRYMLRPIDGVYASHAELMKESRTSLLRRWIPESARQIHFASKARWGQYTNRFSCRVTESEFVRFAQTHSYEIATNSFIMLDYGTPEQEDRGFSRWKAEQMAKDSETQTKLVFGEDPSPKRFFSHTESHAFDGSCAGVSRKIIVFDRDSGALSGYVYCNGL